MIVLLLGWVGLPAPPLHFTGPLQARLASPWPLCGWDMARDPRRLARPTHHSNVSQKACFCAFYRPGRRLEICLWLTLNRETNFWEWNSIFVGSGGA